MSSSIPSNWKNSSITIPLDNRVQLANAAIQKNLPNFVEGVKPDWGDPAHLLVQMITLDRLTNFTNSDPNSILSYFQKIQSLNGSFYSDNAINFPLQYGYAAVQAYQQYGMPQFLSIAEETWAYGYKYTLTQAQADARWTPVLPTLRLCHSDRGSLAGASFWQRDEPLLNLLSTGYFLVLSSHLGMTTSNETYLDAASTSYNFLYNVFYDSGQAFIGDELTVNGTDSDCNPVQGLAWLPQDAALFIEGALIYGQAKNVSTAIVFAESICQLALYDEGAWTDSNGILGTGNTLAAGEGELMRALGVIRNSSLTDPKSLNKSVIDAYISNQYNALLEFASDGHDHYAATWNVSDPSATYWFHNQTQAIYGLLAGIEIASPLPSLSQSSFTEQTARPSQSSGPHLSSTHHSLLGPILGSIAGLVVLLFAILATTCILKQKRKRRKQIPGLTPFERTGTRSFSPSSPSSLSDTKEKSQPEPHMNGSPTGSMRPPGTEPENSESNRSVHDPPRQHNLSQAELIGLLNQPTGNLMGLLSQRVQARGSIGGEESLPVYGSEVGSE